MCERVTTGQKTGGLLGASTNDQRGWERDRRPSSVSDSGGEGKEGSVPPENKICPSPSVRLLNKETITFNDFRQAQGRNQQLDLNKFKLSCQASISIHT